MATIEELRRLQASLRNPLNATTQHAIDAVAVAIGELIRLRESLSNGGQGEPDSKSTDPK
jgi:hypothetical protein